jgi:hypothetical protein
MTSERDIERLLDHWLAERPTQVADRVLDEVADQIARQPQQPAWRVSWRDTHVIGYFKPLAAVAAVILVAVVGFAVLRPSSGPNVGGPASPSPTLSPTSSPSPSASFAYPSSAILPAGSHAPKQFDPAFTFTVPEGWINDGDAAEYYSLFPDTPANQAEFARTGNPANNMVIASQLPRPYFVCEAWEDNRGATAAEMAAAVTGNEAITTTGLVDVAIGGLTGKQFDVRLDPDWTETCPDGTPTSTVADQRARAMFLDRPGSPVLVMFVVSLHAADHEALLAEAMPIVESFQFDLGPEASPS